MRYWKGQKIVCVYEGFWKFELGGRLYTISPEYCPRKDEVYTVDGYNLGEFVRLSELLNTYTETLSGEEFRVPNSWGWKEERFRPLVSRSFSTLVDVSQGAPVDGPEVERSKFRQRTKRWLKEYR